MTDTNPPFAPETVRLRRLRYRATHRGSHECDLLLGGYVIAHLDGMDAATLDALEEVLELPDSDLAEWLTGREDIPEQVATPLLLQIRAAALK